MSLRRDIGTGSIFRYPGCKRWTIQYYIDGRRVREATGSESKRKAQDLLIERLGQVSRGERVARERKPARVEELYLALEDDVKVNRPKSVKDVRGHWKHLRPAFGIMLANKLTTQSVTRYARLRKEEGAAHATINRELATLRRAPISGDDPRRPRSERFPTSRCSRRTTSGVDS